MVRPREAGFSGRPSLVQRLADDLRRVIVSGEIPVGAKLPSEATLTARHEVSRTVVREAVAALRNEGLVEARQGAGVFVISAQPANATPFQDLNPARLSSIVEMMELRIAVEIEAAALAAVRRSPAQEEAIYEALDGLDRAAEAGTGTAEADFRFHLAIARATNNPRFEQFLSMLGTEAIPRSRIQADLGAADSRDYIAQLQGEHRRIAETIAARDAAAASAAMRAHLEGGQRRYRHMLGRQRATCHTTN